jgi:hypothetical protein
MAYLRLIQNNEKGSTIALLSLALSALSAGYICAGISYEYDVNNVNRRSDANFYGLLPRNPTKRTACFGALIINSSLLLTLKSCSLALLYESNQRLLVLYLSCDLGFYLIQKILRRDFLYWIPADGIVGYCLALSARILVKEINDFTGVLQFRHPGELGGGYWTLNMLANVVVVPIVSLQIFLGSLTASRDEPLTEEGVKASQDFEDFLKLSLYSLIGTWVLNALLFYTCAEKKYYGTFFSTETSRERIVNGWLRATTDEKRTEIVCDNGNVWIEIRPQVSDFFLQNWEKWEQTQPDWFTEQWIASVDDDLLPPAFLRRELLASAGTRRRSSVLQRIEGGGDLLLSLNFRGQRRTAAVSPAIRNAEMTDAAMDNDDDGEKITP